MDPNALRDQLTKLHEELRTAPRVDPDSGRLLGELLEDIKQLIARTEASDAGHTGATPRTAGGTGTGTGAESAKRVAGTSLPGRLERIAVLFEVDHPTLAASSRRLVDILGQLGL